MTKAYEIIEFLNEQLESHTIDDHSNNGMQVGDLSKSIDKIGFAVDATLETFEKAKAKGCDMLITHHGISWGDSLKFITGNNYERVSFLTKNNLALATYHLPLDVSLKYGNNAVIAQHLDLRKVKSFSYGVTGELKKELTIKQLGLLLNKVCTTNCKIYAHGMETIRSLAIISGSGSKMVEQASKVADALITGDLAYGMQHVAKEVKTNLVLAGHYETETFGLRALIPALKKKFPVDTVFLE